MRKVGPDDLTGEARSRRDAIGKILACVLAAAGSGAAMASEGQNRLPAARDLAADAATATRERTPILLFFDRVDCPYCERALREYLVPMSGEAPWNSRAIFRQIEVDKDLPVVDFDGAATTHRAIAARYRASLTPTIVVVDGRGTRLGDALVGLMTPDFYAAYIGNAIDAAAQRMR